MVSAPATRSVLMWPSTIHSSISVPSGNARPRTCIGTVRLLLARELQFGQIEVGQPGFDLLPFVSGRDRMPPPGGPLFGPELTMLHVLTGTLSLSIHEARMFALASIARAQPDRYYRYVHLIRIFAPRRARQELEQLMEDFFKDPFIDRFIEEGKQQGVQQGMEQGRQLGRADSATRVLLTILTARGIAIADQLRSRIAECTDPDLLERWATRAATSTTIDEVFAS